MLLSDVPFTSLEEGMKVRSLLTRHEGYIEHLIPREKAKRAEDAEIIIRWEDGGQSWHWHFQYFRVLLLSE